MHNLHKVHITSIMFLLFLLCRLGLQSSSAWDVPPWKPAFNLDVTSLSTKTCFMQTSGRGWNQPMGAEVIQQLATFLIYYSVTPNRTPHHMTEQDALHVSRKMVDLYIWPRNKVQNARRYDILHHWSVVSISQCYMWVGQWWFQQLSYSQEHSR